MTCPTWDFWQQFAMAALFIFGMPIGFGLLGVLITRAWAQD